MKHFMDEVISLNGQWRLYYVKDRILREDGYRDRTDDSLSTPMLSTEQALIQAGYPCIRATVPGNYESPTWAADNRQIVCKRGEGNRSEICVVDTWTGKVRKLISTSYPLSMPVWSPCAVR